MEKTDITDSPNFYRWLQERAQPTQEKFQRIQLELPVPELSYGPQTVTTSDSEDAERGICIIELY